MKPFFLIIFITTLTFPVNAIAKIDVISDYKADNEGQTLCTENIQNAIDFVSNNGGGEVYFPDGKYRTTCLKLKSGVTLNISEKAIIFASPELSDWKNKNGDLVQSDNAENISITGNGEINGNQPVFRDGKGNYIKTDRNRGIIHFRNSKTIKISRTLFKDSPGWTVHIDNCENVLIENIKIRNPIWSVAEWSDGIDINGSRHVIVKNADIETGDDGICLKNINPEKSKTPRKDMFDILIKDCVVASTCNATKIGTETYGNIYDVTFDGITIKKHSGDGARNNISAMTVISADHNETHDITFKNYMIYNCDTPMFICLENRILKIPDGEIGKLYNITFQNINCKESYRTSQINVQEGGLVKNITFENLIIHNFEKMQTNKSPKRPASKTYPESKQFDPMPAFGLFARDTEGLFFRGENVFYDDGNSKREKFVFENVK